MEETLKLIDGIQAHGDDWEEIIKVIEFFYQPISFSMAKRLKPIASFI